MCDGERRGTLYASPRANSSVVIVIVPDDHLLVAMTVLPVPVPIVVMAVLHDHSPAFVGIGGFHERECTRRDRESPETHDKTWHDLLLL